MRFCALLVAFFAVGTLCAPSTPYKPSTPYIVHEKRDSSAASKWVRRDVALDSDSIIPMSIALAQNNLENGYAYLMDVSDPSSSNYGNHWTPEQVIETFAASNWTIVSIISWLTNNGIEESRIEVSRGRNWVYANVTIHEAEMLLKTVYALYEHTETGKRSVECEEYTIPLSLAGQIDYITPTVQSNLVYSGDMQYRNPLKPPKPVQDLPPPVQPAPYPKSNTTQSNTTYGIPAPNTNQTATISLASDLSICGNTITPTCIRKLYNMPDGTLNLSSFAIVEYGTEVYVPSDLSLYLSNLNPQTPSNTSPTISVMPDAQFQAGNRGFNLNGEANLDIELATALASPQKITYYQVNKEEVFLDALDSTFCTSCNGSAGHGSVTAAKVISVSFVFPEVRGDAAQARQCNEYMKLGLMGVTLLYATGDSGVGCLLNQFAPNFPASCPFITAVGATQIPNGGDITSKEVAAQNATIDFSSGGGFSNNWPLLAYQKAAIDSYYDNYAPPYGAADYNNSRTSRGYPDLSAIGFNILTVQQSAYLKLDGTSASTPVVGSLITLINEQRLLAKKPTVGFINPVIYKNPRAFNDITSGSNPSVECGNKGFKAVPGWDPVTGLGTPDYERLLDVFMDLP